jgi:hypothetical protein
VYFPQGHSEQVAASTNKEVDTQIPNHQSLPPQLICQLHNLSMHADLETDEVYAQMTLQPLNPQEQKEPFIPADMGVANKQPTNYFCKTLTASDTSTHGGFSVPRRAAEKVFPPLDFTMQPPCQELIARDLHDNEWKFRHIFRGQPKRHLLTTGWSVFVSAKRLVAGDSVLFIWNEKNQLLLGIRRANRPQTVMPSSVLSSDSMHLGLLAAAAHAAATNSRFTIFYNPRACPSEFVIPLAKYVKAVYHTRVSVGMRFRMLFETEESSVRRYMGTITGISDLDSVRWANSHWRSVKVGWDESTAGERQPRVSLWEIEPLTTFPMYPSTFPLRFKRPWPPGLPSFNGMREDELGMNSPLMWIRGDNNGVPSLNYNSQGISPWMQPRLDSAPTQADIYQAMAAAALQEMRVLEPSKQNPPLYMPHNQFQQPVLHHQILQAQAQAQAEARLIQQTQLMQQQNFTDSNVYEPPPHLLNLPRSNSDLMTSAGWPPKRVAVDNNDTVTLPPFPGRECSIDENNHNNHDAQGNNLLFGVNIDSSSLLMQNDSTNMPPYISSSNYLSADGSDFSLNPSITPSGCIDDSAFLQSPENPASRTFVKVYKSGSFGRSLDIGKFSSYNELRSELAEMFGIEGELEDLNPSRSGWQLVFVDRENDVLLLGDDPWPEFVNNVWCIKILSADEVVEMGKHGLELLNSVQRLTNTNNCENGNYASRPELRNLTSGIAAVGSLHY